MAFALLYDQKVIEKENITLKFHEFSEKYAGVNYFFPLNNREKDLQKSGISNVIKIIHEEYNTEKNSVQTNLKHFTVSKLIEKLCQTNIVNEQETPFLNISLLREEVEKLKENDLEDISNQLNSILVDLHNLGVIVYFDFDILRETVITNPIWFNKVFKSLLDFGRKKIALIFEEVYESIKMLEENKMYKFSKSKNNSKQISRTFLKEILGNDFEKAKVEDIWSEKRENSIIDKLSFNSLLVKLDVLQQKLIEESNEEFLKNFKYSEEEHYDITQCIHSIEEVELNTMINEMLQDNKDKEKRKFLLKLLIKFDLILPKKKVEFMKMNQFYLIPFLFPQEKPKKEIQLKGDIFLSDYKRDYEWKIEYFLPFKPSCMWKVKI